MDATSSHPNWLEALETRLREVEEERAELASSIAGLEDQAQALSEEHHHLRALLEGTTRSGKGSQQLRIAPEGGPLDSASSPGTASGDGFRAVGSEPTNTAGFTSDSRRAGATQAWRQSVRDLLMQRGQPLHYRALHEELRRLGIPFGGLNPPASFLAVLNRDTEFLRVGRGVYWLKGVPVPAGVVRARRVKARRQRIAKKKPT
jgi:hypothetical protein